VKLLTCKLEVPGKGIPFHIESSENFLYPLYYKPAYRRQGCNRRFLDFFRILTFSSCLVALPAGSEACEEYSGSRNENTLEFSNSYE